MILMVALKDVYSDHWYTIVFGILYYAFLCSEVIISISHHMFFDSRLFKRNRTERKPIGRRILTTKLFYRVKILVTWLTPILEASNFCLILQCGMVIDIFHKKIISFWKMTYLTFCIRALVVTLNEIGSRVTT